MEKKASSTDLAVSPVVMTPPVGTPDSKNSKNRKTSRKRNQQGDDMTKDDGKDKNSKGEKHSNQEKERVSKGREHDGTFFDKLKNRFTTKRATSKATGTSGRENKKKEKKSKDKKKEENRTTKRDKKDDKEKGGTKGGEKDKAKTEIEKKKFPGEAAAKKFIDETTVDQAIEEYKQINAITTGMDKCLAWSGNMGRNRHPKYMCLDTNRVVIKDFGTNSYINASRVTVPGYPRTVVLAQLPRVEVANSIEEFWRMVFDEGFEQIRFLSKKDETVDDFVQYFPTKAQSFAYFGSMFLNNRKVEQIKETTKFVMEVLPEGMSNSQLIDVYLHMSWGFNGPEMVSDATTAAVDMFAKTAPMAIISLLGSGRSGALLALSVALHSINENKPIKMFDIVKTIRDQRPMAVDSGGLYAFIHMGVFNFIRKRMPEMTNKIMQLRTAFAERPFEEDGNANALAPVPSQIGSTVLTSPFSATNCNVNYAGYPSAANNTPTIVPQTTMAPTVAPTTMAPTTMAPTVAPTTMAPTVAPTVAPTQMAPAIITPNLAAPTAISPTATSHPNHGYAITPTGVTSNPNNGHVVSPTGATSHPNHGPVVSPTGATSHPNHGHIISNFAQPAPAPRAPAMPDEVNYARQTPKTNPNNLQK